MKRHKTSQNIKHAREQIAHTSELTSALREDDDDYESTRMSRNKNLPILADADARSESHGDREKYARFGII